MGSTERPRRRPVVVRDWQGFGISNATAQSEGGLVRRPILGWDCPQERPLEAQLWGAPLALEAALQPASDTAEGHVCPRHTDVF